MDRERGFKFKLLVPPRLNHSQINAVRPQEIEENYGKLLKIAPQRSCSTSQNNSNTDELCSQLFDEVDKVKSWKVKVDTESEGKERKLQDNKRTIESQRKAIQELQFGNETLSIKLEEQICEYEDLRNKNNATRNLCNILKETCQRTSEKMHLFESERAETHNLFVENSESIKKLLSAFEILRIRVEADQQEMQKVTEDVKQFEDLKGKHHQEQMKKDKEIDILQKKLQDKKDELQKALVNLNEAQKYCKQLQDSTKQQFELLQSLKTEKESLLQNLDSAEIRCEEIKKKEENTAAALEKSKKEYEEIIKNKDLNIQDLNRVKIQQAEELEKIETTIKDLKSSLALEIQRAKDLEDKLITKSSELERNGKLLEETMDEATKKEDLNKILAEELEIKSHSIELLKTKIDALEARADEHVSELSRKTEEIQAFREEKDMVLAENKLFKVKMNELEVQLSAEIKKNKECSSEMKQLKEDILQHKVKYEELLSEHMAIQQKFEEGLSKVKVSEENMQVYEEKITKFKSKAQILEEENQCLRDEISMVKTRIQEACQETETIQKKTEDLCENLQEQISEKEKRIKAAETKLQNLKKKFEMKLKVREDFKNEVQRLKLTSAEAIKDKEDAELKCQNKIADMVALMEKHKRQCDRMVEEKDTELDKNKKKETEAIHRAKSLELDLSNQKAENDLLKKQLKSKETEKELLLKEVTDLKKEMSTAKALELPQSNNKQPIDLDSEPEIGPDSPERGSLKTYTFDIYKKKRTPSKSPAVLGKAVSSTKLQNMPCGTAAKTKPFLTKVTKTPGSNENGTGGTSKITSYRVATPPSSEKRASWGKTGAELDFTSDSSDRSDIFTFRAERMDSTLQQKHNIFKKYQSPVSLKSPENNLKLAAMKRMREAGWTAVTSCDKKKKKTNEKIFE